MKLVLTRAALGDLRPIRDYTMERGEEQESRYLDQLWARFETILQSPERFRPRQDLPAAGSLPKAGM